MSIIQYIHRFIFIYGILYSGTAKLLTISCYNMCIFQRQRSCMMLPLINAASICAVLK